jgi:hypothetical protein
MKTRSLGRKSEPTENVGKGDQNTMSSNLREHPIHIIDPPLTENTLRLAVRVEYSPKCGGSSLRSGL